MGQGRRPDGRGVTRRNAKLKVLRELVGRDRAIFAVDLTSCKRRVANPHLQGANSCLQIAFWSRGSCADLDRGVPRMHRKWPLLTVANGTLMAR